MASIRTSGDYQEAVSRKEITDWERDVREGRIVLVACSVCGALVTQDTLEPEEHLCGLGETWS